MKLKTNLLNLIILSIILFSSSIITNPIRHEVNIEYEFSLLKFRRIELKIGEELVICNPYSSDFSIRMFDHDKILKLYYNKDYLCSFYKAVKAGKFEVLFQKGYPNESFFSIKALFKQAVRDLLFINYKKWEIVVSE